MVSRTNKNKATEYVVDRLEESGLYILQKRDHMSVLVKEKPQVREEPRTIEVVMANFVTPIKEFNDRFAGNRYKDVFTAAVLYKDDKTAFVRTVDRNPSWRTEKSLKNYSALQINRMLHLRGIEKQVLEGFRNPRLTYYQPTTERLEESLRVIELTPVELDYSHIGPGDQGYGFVEDRQAIDYKLPIEKQTIQEGAYFAFTRSQPDHWFRAFVRRQQ